MKTKRLQASAIFLVLCTFNFVLENVVGDKAIRRMFIKRSSADMDSSATSGFIYRSDNNGSPQIQYLGATKNYQQNPSSLPFPYHAAAAHSYVISHSNNDGLGLSSPYPKIEKHSKDDVDFSKAVSAIPEYIQKFQAYRRSGADSDDEVEDSEEINDEDSQYDDDDVDEPSRHTTKENILPAVYHSNHDNQPSKYNDDSAHSSYNSENHSKKGDKGSTDYKSDHQYSHGNSGKYGGESESGHHNENGGNKKSYVDDVSKYNNHHEEGQSSRGGKHSEKKQHKKGSKTTGYHNVYHKDEYKKDHIFYDTADHSGQFSKYGSEHQNHEGQSGSKQQGGYHDSAYKEGNRAKQGSHDRGHFDNAHRDFHKQQGHDSHYENGEKYNKNNANTGNHEYGYKQLPSPARIHY